LIPWWRARTAHWTEQARKLLPARVAARQFEWALPIAAALASRVLWPETHWGWAAAGAYVGDLLGAIPLMRVIVPGLTVRLWLIFYAHHMVARFLEWGVLVTAIILMPTEGGPGMAAVAAGYVVARIALGLGGGLALLRTLGFLRPASPRLARVVAECSAATGVAVRNTWELHAAEANAFAVIATRELLFTRRLLAAMNDDELRAICRHELAHLAESRGTLWLRVAGGFGALPLIFMNPAFAAFQVVGIVWLTVAAFGIQWLQARLSRALENRADSVALVPEESPGVYARTLEALYRTNLTPAVLKGAGLLSHPDLYDRMVAAGVTPDYPRPKPPQSMAATSVVLIGLLAFVGLMALQRR
ncbi:MAG TPA: M48 family metalloprotease, partial [Opitutaceae bacterium]